MESRKSETDFKLRPFFLENTMILEQKLVFVLESHTIFVLLVKYCMSIVWPALAYQLHDQPQRSPHATGKYHSWF